MKFKLSININASAGGGRETFNLKVPDVIPSLG